MDIDSAREALTRSLEYDILDPGGDPLRREIEAWCGGSLRRVFLEGILPHVPRKALVVEMGPADGSWTRALLEGIPDCTVAVVDPGEPTGDALRRWKDRVEVVRSTSGGGIPLPTASADFVFSFGHFCRLQVRDIEALLVELRRVVRPGAAAVLHHGDDTKRASFPPVEGAGPEDPGFPANDAATMASCAVRAGWDVATMDLGFLRRDGFILLRAPSGAPTRVLPVAVADPLRDLREAVAGGRFQEAFERGVRLKVELKQHPGLDRLRAAAFLGLGRNLEALEACKEELRWNPSDAEAASMLESLKECVVPVVLPEDEEFRAVFERIRPYTMLSVERLWSLFFHAREICLEDLPGNFVECGVAAGGSSALLSWVVKTHSRRPRVVFSLDTFEGMPAPTDEDRHQGVAADDTGWGTATCSAPLESLLGICDQLGSRSVVRPLVGLFQDTLPVHRAEMGEIAFLHMDGDWYDSTRAILLNVYDQVVAGGFVQVDDYGHWDGCRKAIHEFESERGLSFRPVVLDSTGVWFRKGAGERCVVPSRVRSMAQGETVEAGLRLLREDRPEEALALALRLAGSGVRAEGLSMLEAVANLRLGRETQGIACLRKEVADYPGNEAARGALADLGVPAEMPPRGVRVVSLERGGTYLNLGCGSTFDPRWVNCDFAPSAAGIRRFDASMPLEFQTESVDVVYSSHMLEHLAPEKARAFLAECRRILRPGGILRLAVPDLEGIARAYLRELEGVDAGIPGASMRRSWMVLELLDQVARHRGGGEMLRWWARDPVPEEAFILQRVGMEASGAIAMLKRDRAPALAGDPSDPAEVGRFRLGGEVHRWMYDRVSLAELLVDTGFDAPTKIAATQSTIPGFAGYGLDVDASGKIRKPDSLFMEAERP